MKAGHRYALGVQKAGFVAVGSVSKECLDFSTAPVITEVLHGGVVGGSSGGSGGDVLVVAKNTILKAANVGEERRRLWTCSKGKADQGKRGTLGLWIVDRLAVHVTAEFAALGAGIVVERVGRFGQVNWPDCARGTDRLAHIVCEG